MKLESVAGGQYAAALVNGQYAVSLVNQGKIKTNLGIFAGPKGDALWLEIYDKKVCSSNHDDKVCEFINNSWVIHNLVAFGPMSVIYDNNGLLHSINKAPAYGYRYCNEQNVLVTATATYADTTRKIWEYTTLNGHTFGQGGEGQYGDDPFIVILPDKTYRKISSGRCRAIRVHNENENFAIGWSQQDKNSAGLLWVTAAELKSNFPVYVPGSSIPPVEPPPVANPNPNGLPFVKANRAKYNDLGAGPKRGWTITNASAWDMRADGAGMFFKDSGEEYNDRNINCILFKHRPGVDPAGKGEMYDCLKSAEKEAEPRWGRTTPTGYGDITKWRAPVEPESSAPPNPIPTNPDRDMLIHIRNEINEFLGE